MLMVANWTFLTNHAWAMLCIAHDPEVSDMYWYVSV